MSVFLFKKEMCPCFCLSIFELTKLCINKERETELFTLESDIIVKQKCPLLNFGLYNQVVNVKFFNSRFDFDNNTKKYVNIFNERLY